MLKEKNNATDKNVLSVETKEVIIPLCEYTDLIVKEAMLEQVACAVAKADNDSTAIAILRAILQIDTSKKWAYR